MIKAWVNANKGMPCLKKHTCFSMKECKIELRINIDIVNLNFINVNYQFFNQFLFNH